MAHTGARARGFIEAASTWKTEGRAVTPILLRMIFIAARFHEQHPMRELDCFFTVLPVHEICRPPVGCGALGQAEVSRRRISDEQTIAARKLTS